MLDAFSELIQAGGWPFVAILVLSLLGWCVLLRKWAMVREDLRRGRDWQRRVETPLREQRYREIRELCAELPCTHTRAAIFSLQSHWVEHGFARHLQSYINSEAASWRVRLGQVSVIAAVLPLLGLLGTVFGMIRTFGVLAGGQDANAGHLAAGITQALITTEAGLLTALPLVLGHSLLSSAMRRSLDEATAGARHLHRLVQETA